MILEKILRLLGFFQENRADAQDVGVIQSWESEAKRLFLLKSLKDHDGVKYILDIFEGEVRKINDQLLNKRQMFEDERYRLLDQRSLAQKYIDLFNGVEDDLEKLEETLDEELSKIV